MYCACKAGFTLSAALGHRHKDRPISMLNFYNVDKQKCIVTRRQYVNIQ